MTDDEIIEYISENDPTETIKDDIGRWSQRIWTTDSYTITETYLYKYTVAYVEEYKPKDSFKVSKVERSAE